jgi:glucose uptake protein GlcU
MVAALMELLATSSPASLAWPLCLAGGVLAGSYPVFIKTPQVIAAKVHPIVFQCYKSFWVPTGFAYIFAVSMCGVATTAVLNTGMSSVLQFLLSIATSQSMRRHGEMQVPLAPFYLVAVVLGMTGLIFSPSMSVHCLQRSTAGKQDRQASASTASMTADGDSLLVLKTEVKDTRREHVVGVMLAILSGLLNGAKYGVTSAGRHHAMNVEMSQSQEEYVKSAFNVFESYMLSFGVGCALSTVVMFGIFALVQKGLRGQPLPSAEFPVMKTYGFLAGATWMGSYMCLQAANNLGGSGAFGPAGNATSLITGGLWGLLYYREVKDVRRVACWVVSAIWTIVFVILLTQELVVEKEE